MVTEYNEQHPVLGLMICEKGECVSLGLKNNGGTDVEDGRDIGNVNE